MIISISGADGIGKSALAKAIVDSGVFLELKLFDTSFCHPNITGKNWDSVVYGINNSLAQIYNSFDNFVRDRYSLDEYVYQKLQNRSGFNWELLDIAGIEKQYLILLLTSYKKYLQYVSHRVDEEIMTEKTFFYTQQLFIEAFEKSKVLSKNIFINDTKFDIIKDDVINWLKYESKENYLTLIKREILQCNSCPLIHECKKCNPNHCKPILPRMFHKNSTIDDITDLFIGVAPGRAKNIPFSIEAFSHSSGVFLERALSGLNMMQCSAVTNIVKCNTPANKIIPQKFADICQSKFLQREIQMFPNLKRVYILGKQANDIYRIPRYLNVINIFHPSFFNYNYTEEKFEQWKKSIAKERV